MKKRRLVPMALVALIFVLGFGWFWWVSDYYRSDVAFSLISDTDSIEMMLNSDQIEYYPNNMQTKTGLIIYPGAKVDYKAYATIARGIAEKGYKTIVVKMPQNIAIFGANKASKIIADNPDIENWALAGHSLGGVVASQYASKNTDKIKEVIFWASYPSKDISTTGLKTLTLYGSNDGFVKDKKIEDTKSLLPMDAEIVKIDGGNHSYFGYYGLQKGDLEATISREEQQKITIDKTASFLKNIDNK